MMPTMDHQFHWNIDPVGIISGINIEKCRVIVVLIAHNDLLGVDGLVFSWGFFLVELTLNFG